MKLGNTIDKSPYCNCDSIDSWAEFIFIVIDVHNRLNARLFARDSAFVRALVMKAKCEAVNTESEWRAKSCRKKRTWHLVLIAY